MQQAVAHEAPHHLEQHLETSRASKRQHDDCEKRGQAAIEHTGAHVYQRLMHTLCTRASGVDEGFSDVSTANGGGRCCVRRRQSKQCELDAAAHLKSTLKPIAMIKFTMLATFNVIPQAYIVPKISTSTITTTSSTMKADEGG